MNAKTESQTFDLRAEVANLQKQLDARLTASGGGPSSEAQALECRNVAEKLRSKLTQARADAEEYEFAATAEAKKLALEFRDQVLNMQKAINAKAESMTAPLQLQVDSLRSQLGGSCSTTCEAPLAELRGVFETEKAAADALQTALWAEKEASLDEAVKAASDKAAALKATYDAEAHRCASKSAAVTLAADAAQVQCGADLAQAALKCAQQSMNVKYAAPLWDAGGLILAVHVSNVLSAVSNVFSDCKQTLIHGVASKVDAAKSAAAVALDLAKKGLCCVKAQAFKATVGSVDWTRPVVDEALQHLAVAKSAFVLWTVETYSAGKVCACATLTDAEACSVKVAELEQKWVDAATKALEAASGRFSVAKAVVDDALYTKLPDKVASCRSLVVDPAVARVLASTSKSLSKVRNEFGEAGKMLHANSKARADSIRAGLPTAEDVERFCAKAVKDLAATPAVQHFAELVGCPAAAPAAAIVAATATVLVLAAALLLAYFLRYVICKAVYKILKKVVKRGVVIGVHTPLALGKVALCVVPACLLRMGLFTAKKLWVLVTTLAVFALLLPFRVVAFPVWTLPRGIVSLVAALVHKGGKADDL
mmetsp:Transcript_21182/g.71730  ORF Transcript_21182/g.71730 Transcript_21182/m.71730 type:complete len:596 (-) Transcript_21182:60-1847(-)